jgi:hypothetical protein
LTTKNVLVKIRNSSFSSLAPRTIAGGSELEICNYAPLMKENLRNFNILLYGIFVVGVCGFNLGYAQLATDEGSRVRSGLAGAQYDDEAFTEVDEDPNILRSLNQDWAANQGNDWRAAWFGFIEGPATGKVTISAEFEDGLEVTVGDQVVIDRIASKSRNQASGAVRMVKGEKLPISIKFVTYNSKALLRVSWQWAGSEVEVIPTEALSFTLDSLPLDLRFEFEYTGFAFVQNWEVYAPLIPSPSIEQIDLSGAVVVALQNVTILEKAADMLVDEIAKRSRIDLRVGDRINDEKTEIVIGTKADLKKNGISIPADVVVPEKKDGYAIWVDESDGATHVYLIGHDRRGALFAAGRLLRLVEMGRDWVFLNRNTRLSTAPVTSLRGHQVGYRPKTNSYDGWTIEMWEQYFRDMIVFGTNAIELLPPRTDDALDSPHFPEPPLQMMVKMSQLAEDYGLDVWIWFPSMEDQYDAETLATVLEEWAVVYKALPKIDVVFVPGGDPGNTHPSVLLPFLEAQKKSLNKYHANGQIWMSPQGFDWRDDGRGGWLQNFYDILNDEGPEWLDGIVFGPQVPTSLAELREAIPEKYPIRRYPDITHSGGGQYEVEDWDEAYDETLAREPINPRPYFYADIYRKLQAYAIGFITYSEGCNDDVNKMIWSALGWDPDQKVETILKEYSRYFIGLRYEETFARGLRKLEENWAGPLAENEGVYETLELFQKLEADATPQDKLNWRFQQAMYRAFYDAHVKARLPFSIMKEKESKAVLREAVKIGALSAASQAEEIIDRPFDNPIANQWRARVYELAEALYQSARMQQSVPRYKAIRRGRGATLDTLDAPLFNVKDMKRTFMRIRIMDKESDRLKAIEALLN